jgi:gas vesicle protein
MDFLLPLDWGDVVESLLGVIVGGAIALAASVIVQRMQSTQAREQQRDQWDQDRTQQREQWSYEQAVEHARYQRDTLGELQAHIDEFVSTARSISSEGMTAYRNATQEQIEAGKIEMSDHYREMMRRFRDANRHVKVLAVRIEDVAIRERLEEINRLAQQLVHRSPALWAALDKADRSRKDPWYEIVDLATEANKAIGTAIRTRAEIVRPD